MQLTKPRREDPPIPLPHLGQHSLLFQSIPPWPLCQSSAGPLGPTGSQQGGKAVSDSVGKQARAPAYGAFLGLFP